MRSPLNDALNRKWSEASATLEKLERENAALREQLVELAKYKELIDRVSSGEIPNAHPSWSNVVVISKETWASYEDALEQLAERERADRNQEDAERWRAAKQMFEAGYEMEDGEPAIALFLPEHLDPNAAIDAARRKQQ